MKTVIVRPERCVSCLQCRFACAVAHSEGKDPHLAHLEPIRPRGRIHIALSSHGEPFPNKCRHCDPAPCAHACLTRAIAREEATGAILVEPQRCINCGMCAMACPFAVIRYRPQAQQRIVALKCDQCQERQKENRDPACVEVCKTGALLFADYNVAAGKAADRLAELVYLGLRGQERAPLPGAYANLQAYKQSLQTLRGR